MHVSVLEAGGPPHGGLSGSKGLSLQGHLSDWIQVRESDLLSP